MEDIKMSGRHNWRFSQSEKEIIKDKEQLKDSYIAYMFNRTQRIFDYNDSLPKHIEAKNVENWLQRLGTLLAIKDGDKLYITWFAWGSELDEWYIPTKCIVTNPYLPKHLCREYTRDVDCVVIWNDSNGVGLMPMFKKYAELLAETDISLRFADINARFHFLLKAETDKQKTEAEDFIKNIEDGKKLGVIGGASVMEKFSSSDISGKSSGEIKDLIELKQYLSSQWFIDLGLNANFNMKREAINSAESGMNDDILLPLIDDMHRAREKSYKDVKDLFGFDIKVELSSSWKQIHAEYHAKEDGIKETETTEENPESEDNAND